MQISQERTFLPEGRVTAKALGTPGRARKQNGRSGRSKGDGGRRQGQQGGSGWPSQEISWEAIAIIQERNYANLDHVRRSGHSEK